MPPATMVIAAMLACLLYLPLAMGAPAEEAPAVAAPPLFRSPPALGWNDWNEIARKYPPWHPSGVNETIVLQQAVVLALVRPQQR